MLFDTVVNSSVQRGTGMDASLRLHARYFATSRFAQAAQRAFDITVSLLGLLVLAPFFGLVAILIKLDSAGSVFFRQTRVGRHRRPFRMWKFRKMHENMPQQGPSVTKRFDSRLTPVGRFLERTKLDELPQLLNVLAGHMSIVGPRPEVPDFIEYYPDKWDQVLSVKPGLFGPNQLRHRNESELYPPGCADVEAFYVENILPGKLDIDGEYARTRSLTGDFLMLLRCVVATILGTVTRRTIANRRWQVTNFLLLSILGIGGMVAAQRLTGQNHRDNVTLFAIAIAAIVKPVCLLAFKIPRALATSLTVADLLRCCRCAATSAALITCGMMFLDHRGMGRLWLLLDTSFFAGVLLLYRIMIYKAYLRFWVQKSRDIPWHLLGISALLGPLSMAFVVTLRSPGEAWNHKYGFLHAWLVGSAAIVRPLFLLFRPVSTAPSPVAWLLYEWKRLFLGTIIGSSFLVFSALLVNERGLGRFDITLDTVVYMSLMTAVCLWRIRYHQDKVGSNISQGAHGQNGPGWTKERVLIAGEGIELNAYIQALEALPEHHFEIAGVISPLGKHRSSMVGGHPIIGEVCDIPEILQVLSITKVIVMTSTMDKASLDYLEHGCPLRKDQILHVDLLSPLLRKWRMDIRHGRTLESPC